MSACRAYVVTLLNDLDSLPPLSIYYPPSSHLSLLKLVPISLPPNSLLVCRRLRGVPLDLTRLQDTAVIIVLDWTKPSTMVRALLLHLDVLKRF